MVVLRENILIPRFAEPGDRQPRDFDRNMELLRRANKLVEEISAKRKESLWQIEFYPGWSQC
jgi:hypothetical protein